MASRKTEKLKYSKTIKLPHGTGYTPQSLAFIDNSNRVVVCSGTSPNRFLKCSASSYSNKGKCANVGHANGATYCSKNNTIYVSAYEGSSNNYKVRALDSSSYKLKFTVTLPTTCSGIAYDKVTNQFYVSSGSKIYIYPYDAFTRSGKYTGKYTHFSKQFNGENRNNQDIGGHNGIVMVCKSKQGLKSQTSYIDCYNAANGKYLKSYYSTYGELESVAVDATGNMHVLFAQDRKLVRTTNVFNLAGDGAAVSTTSAGKPISAKSNAERVIKKAESYLGQGGDAFWNYSGLTRGLAWCAAFVWSIINMCGLSECCYPKGTWRVDNCRIWMEKNSNFKKVYSYNKKGDSLTNILKGDILITMDNNSTDQHICFARSNGTASAVTSIDGNWSGKVSSYSRAKNGRYKVQCAFRPPYGVYYGNDLVLQVNPEKLYRSDNYTYLPQEAEKEDPHKAHVDALRELIGKAQSEETFTPVDTKPNAQLITSGILDTAKLASTKVAGEVFGPSLPIALDPVEAPFVELTIGDYSFGTYDKSKEDAFPNYIDSMNVKRTNGSINEYTINLVHQIRPGSNPNFIDELLSKNSYNKITIKYGDANSQIIFNDEEALLIDTSISFDFVNCNIKYIIKATSSAISIASHKRTFASVEDKPSNVIRNLLYNDTSNDLLNAFPRMRDKSFVAANNLIPTNDTTVQIDEFKNINAISYLGSLVSIMQNIANKASTYMLVLSEGYFKISEISNDYVYDSLLYEVDVGFPDNNQVFSFGVDTNYSWPIAYEYAGRVSNYNYDITSGGDLKSYPNASHNLLDFASQSQSNLTENWWTQVTEFPVSAKLTCRGLLSPLLLLTYIKINCKYFGTDRITSGVYIVTGQEDSLSGSGYRSTISLLRVSGPQQHITIDGRVKT